MKHAMPTPATGQCVPPFHHSLLTSRCRVICDAIEHVNDASSSASAEHRMVNTFSRLLVIPMNCMTFHGSSPCDGLCSALMLLTSITHRARQRFLLGGYVRYGQRAVIQCVGIADQHAT
jgi:hypothetical protein